MTLGRLDHGVRLVSPAAGVVEARQAVDQIQIARLRLDPLAQDQLGLVEALARAGDDRGRRQALRLVVGQVGDRLVEVDQPGAGDDPLDRDVLEALAQLSDDLPLALALRRQVAVAALGGEGGPAVAGRHQADALGPEDHLVRRGIVQLEKTDIA